MGFRFRKSIKVAPGVKLNLSKKGASVTVGNKYVRTTVGKNRKSVSASIPGTGVSYVKQSSTKKKQPNTVNNSNNFSAPPTPKQQLEWSTALKIIKWAFFALLGFILLMMVNDSPAALLGVALIVGGMILTRLKKQGSFKTFHRTWIVSAFGWGLALVLWVTGMEPVEEVPATQTPNNEMNALVSTPQQQESVVETKIQEEPLVETPPEEIVEEAPVESVEAVVTNKPEPLEETVEPEPVVEREYFKNCKEMNAVYPNGVSEDHPAYDTARDRDKDGWACEK